VDLVCATRDPDPLQIAVKGIHPAGCVAARDHQPDAGGQAYAFLKGRGYVTPQDVKASGMDVLRQPRGHHTTKPRLRKKTSEIIIQKIF